MGGFVVQKYLETNTCKQAILLTSVPPKGALAAATRFLFRHPKEIVHLLRRDIFRAFHKHAEELYHPNTDEELIETYRSQMTPESFRAFLQMVLQPVKSGNISTKLLIIGGYWDRIISSKEVVQTGDTYAQTALVLQDFGHNLMLEPNYPVVAELIAEWLDEASVR